MTGASACAASHSHTILSLLTTFFCCILFLLTVFLNSIIIFIVIKDRQSKFKLFFYKLLLNIAIADALTGLITDTVYIGVHIKEAIHHNITDRELLIAHTIMFMLGGVSLITLMYLCLDRIVAILRPLAYRTGISNWKSRCIISSTWILSAIQASTYLLTGFMKALIIFTAFNVVIAFCLLLVTVCVYHHKMTERIENPESSEDQNPERLNLNSSRPESKKRSRNATLAFVKMLLVLIISYLPACVITVYFNVCYVCNCLLIDIFRDVSILSILSGSLFRAVNFIFTLKSLRKEAIKIFRIQNTDNSVSESVDSAEN